VGIKPSSRAIIGSQEVPWIYEDRIDGEDFVNALLSIYNMSKEEREELGKKGRDHIMNNYSMNQFREHWVKIFDDTIEKHGSWEDRKNYQSWELTEIK